ncbi:MAG TPA: hypothetical protein VMU93_14830 [Caulobacteraceae bacterium]|nr:hypothetical protein [Caulobacteraceae bacterium]
MLILEVIDAAKRAGVLIPARPIAPWAGEPRAFLMCQPLHAAIVTGRSDTDPKVRGRWAALEAAISHFIEGGYVTQNLLKQLTPYKFEHWTLRSTRPRPSLRVFGRFAMPDVFVGTHVCERPTLGGKWSPQYEQEKLVCEQHWKAAGLPDEPPPGAFSSESFEYSEYITSNASRNVQVPR